MKKFLKSLVDIIEVVLLSFVIVFICFNFLFISAQVDGKSMYPTLEDKERGFSFIISKKFGIDRFDICVINPNDPEDSDKLIVKRIIGLPNETIEYKDNKLYINGEYVVEEFLDDDITNDLVVTLKDNEYFCLGDNREVSKDSRFYGSFSYDQIKSLGFFTIYPFENFGLTK